MAKRTPHVAKVFRISLNLSAKISQACSYFFSLAGGQEYHLSHTFDPLNPTTTRTPSSLAACAVRLSRSTAYLILSSGFGDGAHSSVVSSSDPSTSCPSR